MPDTMTKRAWRLDAAGAHPAGSERDGAVLTPDPVTASMDAACELERETYKGAGLIARWNGFIRTWARTSLERLCAQTTRFEAELHELTEIIETADNPATLKAALLRQAQRLVPAHHIEVTTVSAPCGAHEIASPLRREGDVGLRSLSGSVDCQDGRSILELPLRCGPAVRGRLRIRPRARGRASLSQETIRRLTTLCTLSACALERLDYHVGWPEQENLAPPADVAGIEPCAGAGQTGARFVNTADLHDATFLNAVLPFALNQARRHNETLSLVCVAIDRLVGIQELMGRAVVDQLVQSVGETVADLIRASDIAARLDDNRVIAVLPRAPGKGALHVAQKICEVIANKSHDGCEVPKFTVSIGVATFPSCADDVYALFDAADEALERAQSEGRNRAALAPRRTAVLAGESVTVRP